MSPVASSTWPYWEIEHRRNFSNLKEGIHLPGYTGYLPQFKYKLGDTYARSCKELSQTQVLRKPLPPIPPKNKPGLSEKRDDHGLHKYTEKMVPGYTGYVPHRRYNYGENYNDDCNRCIGTFLQEKSEIDERRNRFQSQVKFSRKLSPIATTDDVLEKIKTYNVTVNSNFLDRKKRESLEPPKIGWTGHVPRIKVTDLALGKRKADANREGILAFQEDQENRRKVFAQPVDPEPESDEIPQWAIVKKSPYDAEGLKPKYTGFIPHRKFVCGQTYGEMTRQASVCARKRL